MADPSAPDPGWYLVFRMPFPDRLYLVRCLRWRCDAMHAARVFNGDSIVDGFLPNFNRAGRVLYLVLSQPEMHESALLFA